MPANLVKTQADEAKWKRAKKIVRKQYGRTEGKWPVVTTIFENMKKNASFEKRAEDIFWIAFNDELEKIGGTQIYLGSKLLSVLRDPKKAKAALEIMENASRLKSIGKLTALRKSGPARRMAAAKGFTGTGKLDMIKQRVWGT